TRSTTRHPPVAASRAGISSTQLGPFPLLRPCFRRRFGLWLGALGAIPRRLLFDFLNADRRAHREHRTGRARRHADQERKLDPAAGIAVVVIVYLCRSAAKRSWLEGKPS